MHGIVRICGGSISLDFVGSSHHANYGSLHPQQIMKQYSINLLYSPTIA